MSDVTWQDLAIGDRWTILNYDGPYITVGETHCWRGKWLLVERISTIGALECICVVEPPPPPKEEGFDTLITPPTPILLTSEEQREQAVAKGFLGDSCVECGNFTLIRNGTCLKCNTCGATTGCS